MDGPFRNILLRKVPLLRDSISLWDSPVRPSSVLRPPPSVQTLTYTQLEAATTTTIILIHTPNHHHHTYFSNFSFPNKAAMPHVMLCFEYSKRMRC
jgi:hypothetical protein